MDTKIIRDEKANQSSSANTDNVDNHNPDYLGVFSLVFTITDGQLNYTCKTDNLKVHPSHLVQALVKAADQIASQYDKQKEQHEKEAL